MSTPIVQPKNPPSHKRVIKDRDPRPWTERMKDIATWIDNVGSNGVPGQRPRAFPRNNKHKRTNDERIEHEHNVHLNQWRTKFQKKSIPEDTDVIDMMSKYPWFASFLYPSMKPRNRRVFDKSTPTRNMVKIEGRGYRVKWSDGTVTWENAETIEANNPDLLNDYAATDGAMVEMDAENYGSDITQPVDDATDEDEDAQSSSVQLMKQVTLRLGNMNQRLRATRERTDVNRFIDWTDDDCEANNQPSPRTKRRNTRARRLEAKPCGEI